MPPLAEDSQARTKHETFAGLNAGEFVTSIARSIRAIAQLYVNALHDSRLDADMLLGMLHLGTGATQRELAPAFGFVVNDAGEVIDRLIAAGVVSMEANEMLRPTKEAQAIFSQLSRLAQRENLRWREQLHSMPGGHLFLDEFLTMLQSSHNP